MNLALLIGALWGIHDANKANNEIDLNKIDIDQLIYLTRNAKRAQAPERFVLENDERNNILSKLKKANVDNEAIKIIDYIINKSIFKRTTVNSLVQALID